MTQPRRLVRTSRFRGRRPRRKLVWARTSNLPAGTIVAPGTVVASDLLADYITQSGGDSLNGATLMAVRGRIIVTWNGSTDGALTVGIREGNVQDVTLPAAQLLAIGPGAGGRYLDWLYRDYWVSQALIVAAGSSTQPAVEYPPLMIRSRRKIDELNSTIMLFAQCDAGSATTPRINFAIDCLLALP